MTACPPKVTRTEGRARGDTEKAAVCKPPGEAREGAVPADTGSRTSRLHNREKIHFCRLSSREGLHYFVMAALAN